MNENNKNLPFDPLADSLGIDSEITSFSDNNLNYNNNLDNFSEQVEADYELSRTNIISTLEKADDALNKIIQVAEASQSPRAFEVVATLIKTIFDGNKDLLSLAKQSKELTGKTAEENTTINNNLIVTTDQLQKMLKDQGVISSVRQTKTIESDKNE